jgi:hypothetical protein
MLIKFISMLATAAACDLKDNDEVIIHPNQHGCNPPGGASKFPITAFVRSHGKDIHGRDDLSVTVQRSVIENKGMGKGMVQAGWKRLRNGVVEGETFDIRCSCLQKASSRVGLKVAAAGLIGGAAGLLAGGPAVAVVAAIAASSGMLAAQSTQSIQSIQSNQAAETDLASSPAVKEAGAVLDAVWVGAAKPGDAVKAHEAFLEANAENHAADKILEVVELLYTEAEKEEEKWTDAVNAASNPDHWDADVAAARKEALEKLLKRRVRSTIK